MKQKNLVLMVVAVGCGLAAAFLTSQMTGRNKTDVQLVEILVAAKPLDPGTKFTKDSVKDLVKTKKMQPNEVPQNAASSYDDLIDKQLKVTRGVDDHISVADLGVWEGVQPPPGHDLVTVRVPIEYMTPFIKATSRVDMLGIVKTRRGNMVKGTTLIPHMLVMAVDANPTPGDGKQGGALNYQLVTLAAKPDEAMLIRLAENANVQISFTLLNKDAVPPKSGEWTKDKVIKWINDSQMDAPPSTEREQPQEATAPPTTPVPQPTAKLQKYLVPKANLDIGTALTMDVITEKFESREAEQLPNDAVTDLKPFVGKFVVAPLWKDEAFKATALGEDPKAKPAAAPTAPDVKPETPKAPERKFTEFTRTIYNPPNVKTYRYRLYDGETEPKLMGEVQPDGSLVPVAGGETPEKKAAPSAADGKKES
jgi:pilus assembly protein CpaB